jgi:hypothetical protein
MQFVGYRQEHRPARFLGVQQYLAVLNAIAFQRRHV